MVKFWSVLLAVVAVLFVAPVIESSSDSQVFQAIGTADGGGW